MLEVIAGMVFTFLLLSLLGTTINELLSSWRGWRGYYLEEGLKRLLEYKDNPDVFERFMKHPYFRQLFQYKALLRISRVPSYLSNANFANILTGVLKKKGKALESAKDLIEGLPEGSNLREVLEHLESEGAESVEDFKNRLQGWFDDVMWQASGWYKRHMQLVTLLVGLGIAAGLNADAIQMYRHLTTNVAAREQLNLLAEAFVQNNPELPQQLAPGDSLSMEQIRTGVREFVESDDFSNMSNILGLGWQPGDLSVGAEDWTIRIFGWLLTALAISLGAPFWFDILKKIINIRSSGNEESRNGPAVVINTGNAETKD
ncbi:MAG: hypothetical protein Kow0027_17210 [Saprospiraceae bacterium]